VYNTSSYLTTPFKGANIKNAPHYGTAKRRLAMKEKDATFGQATKILDLFGDTPKDQIQGILSSGLLADLRDGNISEVDRNEFRKLLGLNALNAYRLIVNYDRSVEKAIKAGRYDWTNDNITSKNFPTKRSETAEIDIELIHFNRDMSTDEVLAELDKKGLRPAELHELLALGEKHPDLQREFPIIALGSVWRRSSGFRSCPCLSKDGSERDLDLGWFGHEWDARCRFAALRK